MSWGPAAHKTAGSGFERRTPARRAKAREGFGKRVFEIDIERCPQCGGTLKFIAAIERPPVIAKILSISACPPEHRPEQRPGPSIDFNWPDPPPIPASIRFGP